MKNNQWETVLGDLPDMEDPVADVYYKNQHVFQLFNENCTGFIVKFANNPNGNYWEFPYEEAMEVLQEAKEHLAKLQRTPEEQARYEARMKELDNWKPTPEEQADYEAKMEAQRKKMV